MSTQPTIGLNDGNVIPQLAFGVWQVPDEEAALGWSAGTGTGVCPGTGPASAGPTARTSNDCDKTSGSSVFLLMLMDPFIAMIGPFARIWTFELVA